MSATTTPVVTTTPNYNGPDTFAVAGYVEGVSADYALDVLTSLVGDYQEATRLLADSERAAWAAARG